MKDTAAGLMNCQIDNCPKQYAVSNKVRLDIRNRIYLLTLQMITRKITPGEYRDKVHTLIVDNAKSKNAIKMMTCNLKHCKEQLHSAMKFIDKRAGVTFDPTSLKNAKDYNQHLVNSSLKIMDEAYENIKKKLEQQEKK